MSLSQAELTTLGMFLGSYVPGTGCATHGSLFMDDICNNHEAIAQWLDEVPESDLSRFSYPLTDIEYAQYLEVENFEDWVAQYVRRLHANDQALAVMGQSLDDLRRRVRLMDGLLFEYKIGATSALLSQMGLRDVVYEAYRNAWWDLLDVLLLLCVSGGVLTSTTGLRIQVEMAGVQGAKRWQALGFSSCPTVEEISAVLD